MKIIKPGSVVTDKGTGLKGMITHVVMEMGNTILYIFQPPGINPEDGQPVGRLWVVAGRLEGGEMIDLPDFIDLSILGTEATDEASGFSGIITNLTLHISGCVHAAVQPQKKHPKNGGRIDACDFDLRRLTGPKLKKLTESEREKSQRERPSPSDKPTGMPG
jgi:hypothetical protein